jgi:hypothetical protein
MAFEIRVGQVMSLNWEVDTNGDISPAFVLQWLMFRKSPWFDREPDSSRGSNTRRAQTEHPRWKATRAPSMCSVWLRHPQNGRATLNGLTLKVVPWAMVLCLFLCLAHQQEVCQWEVIAK